MGKNLVPKVAIFAMAFSAGLMTTAASKNSLLREGVCGLPSDANPSAIVDCHRYIEPATIERPSTTTARVGPDSLRIILKPKAFYTDEARNASATGSVKLKVAFLASGRIGEISVISGMPYGLTDEAIAAAKRIEFEPKKANGVPVSVTRVIQYSFSIY
jgi:TonB family protein